MKLFPGVPSDTPPPQKQPRSTPAPTQHQAAPDTIAPRSTEVSQAAPDTIAPRTTEVAAPPTPQAAEPRITEAIAPPAAQRAQSQPQLRRPKQPPFPPPRAELTPRITEAQRLQLQRAEDRPRQYPHRIHILTCERAHPVNSQRHKVLWFDCTHFWDPQAEDLGLRRHCGKHFDIQRRLLELELPIFFKFV